jgi:hypothetical protein
VPKSKHRHKGGGKAIKHPGREYAPAMPPDSPEMVALPPDSPDMVAFRRLQSNYTGPFYKKWRNKVPHHADVLLDCISDAVFDPNTLTLRPAGKDMVFQVFTEPVEDGETLTVETAEAALAFLVEQGFALVDGDQITIPAKFIPEGMEALAVS